MPLSIAQDKTALLLMDRARSFFGALKNRDLDVVWHHQISRESAELLACALFPACASEEGRFAEIIQRLVAQGRDRAVIQGFAFAFHQDMEEIRTGFFRGLAESVERVNWDNFNAEQSLVFVDGACAVFIGDAGAKASILTFVHDPDLGWLVDMQAWVLFSQTVISAKLLYTAAKTAERENAPRSAFALYELTAALWHAHERIRKLLVDNAAASRILAEDRIRDLNHDAHFSLLARHEVLLKLSGDNDVACDVDMADFMRASIRGYSSLDISTVTVADLKKLHGLSDDVLRVAVASMFQGVDPVVAQREARKPHGPAEVADMELPIRYDGRLVYLCIPFKSGREVRVSRVPVDIAYQIIRPFIYLPNAIVLFITAKPCSQHLLNYIKQARATQGWGIEVLEHYELAALLKIQGTLAGP